MMQLSYPQPSYAVRTENSCIYRLSMFTVLADRGRLNHAIRRVPELPPEIMTQLAREFTLPVEEMRGSVAEADKQGLLTAATAAPGGKSKGKGAATAAAAAIKSAAAAGAKKVGSRSVVVVSGLRGAAAASKNKGGSKTKGLSAPGVGSRVKSGKSGSGGAVGGGRSKASAAATTEEPEGDDEWMPGGWPLTHGRSAVAWT